METERKNITKTFITILIIIIFTLGVLAIMNYYNLIPKEYFKASDFDIKTVYSDVDYDNDKIDDYTDFILGAREDAENHPVYISKYYEDAYPPDYEGVCTDVIWRAFKNAGYSLRDMMDYDIMNNPNDYEAIQARDNNIDFRRVVNQRVFFEKYAIKLTLDPKEIEQWQPGDIAFFEDNHVGIISDRRNKDGIAYVIHNSGQPTREEDYLTKRKITGHYRFDASKIPQEILKKWQEK